MSMTKAAQAVGLHRGHRVAILNRTFSGEIIFEGWATVTSGMGPDQANVRFDGERKSVQRFVDWRAQHHPEEYVADLNAKLKKARN